MERTGSRGAAAGVGGGEVPIVELANDALIIRLHFTVNHLSRWLTPIHDQAPLGRAVYRGEPSVKELVVRMREEEERIFSWLHAIANRTLPDLDALPAPRRSAAEERRDREATTIEVMAEFRRVRQSTCALLRGLPDDAWSRTGISRREHDRTVRGLAEHLAAHDRATLAAIDRALDRVGVRRGITSASRAHLDELLRLSPATRR